MSNKSHPEIAGTHTARGFVPHLPMRDGAGHEFDAPVKVTLRLAPGGLIRWEPVTVGDMLVFALPGGGEILDAAAPPTRKGTK